MNSLPFLLAWRYLLGSQKEKSISTMVVICFLGIIIGSFALALVASVMSGFEKATHEQMQGIHSQLIVHAQGNPIRVDKIVNVIQQEFPAVTAMSASGSGQAIIQNQDTEEVFNVVLVKGIDPIHEPTITNLATKIIATNQKESSLPSLLAGNTVIVGSKLAELIDVKPGQSINVLVTADSSSQGKHIELTSKKATVTGTFKIGVDEFDMGCIFCSLDFLQKLFPDSSPTHIGLQLAPSADEAIIAQQLSQRLGLTVESWKDLYPALVSALKLEKYAMFFILALITLVASMNIISLMFMHITRKRADIAILKTMGMTNASLSFTFLLIGMIIALIGSIIGLVLAFGVGLILQHYPFITLPDIYYTTHLPIHMSIGIFLTVFLVVMGLSFLSTWLSTRRTHNINISQVLRSEG